MSPDLVFPKNTLRLTNVQTPKGKEITCTNFKKGHQRNVGCVID